MRNVQSDYLFDYLIEGYEPQKRATLMHMYSNCLRIQEENRKRELEIMKKEIVDEVLARISVRADTKDAILQIEQLKKALQTLVK